jgi:hypothetical protein
MDKEEILLLGEIFKIYVTASTIEIFRNLKINTSEFVHLPEIERQVNKLIEEKKKISEHPQIIESIIVERLNVPNVEVFQYLIESFYRIKAEQDKSWNSNNPNLQIFFTEGLSIIRNYLSLCVTTPEFFENANFKIISSFFDASHINHKIATFLKLLMKFQDLEVAETIYEALNEDNSNLYEQIKKLFFMEIQNKLTIFDSKWDDILNLIIFMLSIRLFKQRFMMELNAINKAQNARQIENFLLFGLILSITLIPDNMDPRMDSFEKKATVKIENCKTKNEYLKTCNVN